MNTKTNYQPYGEHKNEILLQNLWRRIKTRRNWTYMRQMYMEEGTTKMIHNLETIKKHFRSKRPYTSDDFALEHEITLFEKELNRIQRRNLRNYRTINNGHGIHNPNNRTNLQPTCKTNMMRS